MSNFHDVGFASGVEIPKEHILGLCDQTSEITYDPNDEEDINPDALCEHIKSRLKKMIRKPKPRLKLYFDLDRCVVTGTTDPTVALSLVTENLELGCLDYLLNGVSREIDPRDGALAYGEPLAECIEEFSEWCSNMSVHARTGMAVMHIHGGVNPEPKWTFREDPRALPVVIFY